MLKLLPVVTALLYFTSALLAGWRLFSDQKITRPLVLWTAFAAVIAHTLLLWMHMVQDHGINLAFFHALSLSGWITACVLLLSAITKPVDNLGIILFPLIAVTLLVAATSSSNHLIQAESGWSLGLHVVISLFAWSLLTIAAVQAILFAIQERHLHNHHPGGFVRALPPLQTMEDLLFEIITGGFAFLTLSLLTGFLFVQDLFAQHLAHKTFFSMIAWIVFAVLLWGRYRFGWRGRTAINWTLGGVVVLAVGYLGSKFVLEIILKRTG